MNGRSTSEMRVLLLTPTTKDAETSQSLLHERRIPCLVCRTISDLCTHLSDGVGAIVVPEEAILVGGGTPLAEALSRQPTWSNLPVIVLTAAGPDISSKVRSILKIGDVTLLKRPIEVMGFLNAIDAALRDRERQYLVRDQVVELQRAQEALARSDERLRFALAAGHLGSWELDLSTGEMQCSDTCKANYGRRPDAPFTYQDLGRTIHPDDRELVRTAIQVALSGGQDYDVEYRIMWPDDSIHWVMVRGRLARDQAGSFERMSGVSLDVTERKRAEEELRSSEARFRAFVTATSDAVYRMNADWSQMLQLDGRSYLEDTAAPCETWVEKYLRPDDRAPVLNAIRDSVQTGCPFELEHRVVRVDGSEGWTFSRAVPVRDAANAIVEWFGAASDVTARRQTERALAELTAELDRKQRLYETILSSTPDLIYVFDLDHRFTYANDALLAMWGKTWDESIGKNCLELGYEPWHAAMHDAEIERVIATKAPIRGEVPFTGVQGRRIYDYIFTPVIGADGEVEAIAGTTRDVTERKAMEEDLRDADRKKDDFIAMLAHELRNPLAPLRNGLQVMRLAGGDVNVVSQTRGMMERQLSHMVRLVDDLLDISRISRNKMELRRERVLLADAINAAVETARPLIDAAGHELQVSLPSGPVFIDADLTRLSQIFSNLLTNSAKYTEHGGRIRLTGERQNGDVVITVQDNGIGIPLESLNVVFDMFSQVDRSMERSTGGLGIGLALVKGLVEMHAGTVTAHSEGLGHGSIFTVRLPTADGRVKSNGDFVGPSRHRNRRVLVVDDNLDGAASMAMMLRLLGDEVSTAHDGVEAVRQAEEIQPDLILMDVGMPRLNGLEATQRIREKTWGKHITIIALTGWGQDDDKNRSSEAGCDGHLVKPVSLSDLEQLLGRLRDAQKDKISHSHAPLEAAMNLNSP